MNYLISLLITLLFSFSITQCNSRKTILTQSNWIEHREEYPDAGFVIEFKFPSNLVIAGEIDNCLCVGTNTDHYYENEASFEDNSRQWCICLYDSSQFTADYLISSWKTVFKGEVMERRDTVIIGNFKTLRTTLKSSELNGSFRQLIYLMKFSTLFEVMNVDELTSKDFEVFCESIRIVEYKKP